MAFDDGIKTVSGSIAHTDDAAAKVPFVSVKCGIEPTLDGVTEIDCTLLKKNFFSYDLQLYNGYWLNNTFNGNGQPVDYANATGWHFYKIPVKEGDKITCSGMQALGGVYCAFFKDTPDNIVSMFLNGSTNGTRTVPTGANFVGIEINRGGTPQRDPKTEFPNAQLEISASATAYEAYNATLYHVELGQTVHGGYAEIIGGSGAKTHNTIDMGLLDWTYHPATTTYADFFDCYLPNDSITGDSQVAFDGLTEDYKSIQSSLIALPNQPLYDDMVMALAKNTRRFIICDQRYTSASALTTALTGKILVYPILNPITFTITPREIETVGNVNNVYCNTGDTEVTYYDNAHGFAEVTVNKTGKNLIDGTKFTRGLPSTTIGASIDTITTSNRYAYYGIRAGGGSLTVSSTSSDTDYFTLVLIWGYKDGVLTYYSNTQPGTSKTVDFSNCDYVRIGIGAKSGTTVPTDLTGYGTIQLELGSQATEYEPYEAVSKTAYLHKVIYGGKADVIRGTCEPKNLLKNLGTFPYTISASEQYYTEFSNYIQARKIPLFALENNVTYTLSLDVQCSNEPFYVSICVGDGRYLRDIYNSGATLTSGRVSITFTPTGLTDGNNYLAFRAPRYGSKKDYDVTVDNVQLEKASSATDFAPYFEPFSFPPISMSTDEGENTLFANEGDSAITYRKAVD